MLKKIFVLIAFVMVAQAQAFDLTALKVDAARSGLNEADIAQLIRSDKAVCIQVVGKLMLASKSAVAFRGKNGMGCTESVQRKIIAAGKELVIVKKSMMENATYEKFSRAYLRNVSAN
jgi:hypothetical protein